MNRKTRRILVAIQTLVLVCVTILACVPGKGPMERIRKIHYTIFHPELKPLVDDIQKLYRNDKILKDALDNLNTPVDPNQTPPDK